MKKKLLILPIALLGLTLSGCGNSTMKDNFTAADQVIDTPWSDYVLPATGIEFAPGEEAISLQKGETHAYQYAILPRGATANSLEWFSDNENIATVDKGVVTAVGGGETKIVASSPEASFDPVELSVSVVVPLVDFSLTIPEKLDWDAQYRIEATYQPADTTERNLKYEISESSVENLVSVSEQGILSTGKQNGTAKLKVTGGNIVKEYALNVNSIAVSSVSLKDVGHELKVNSSLQLEATVSPDNARDLLTSGVKYYSKNPEIATVNETNGLVLGVASGNAAIYAECGGVKSTDYAIEVFKVNVTAVDITTNDFTLSNATAVGLSKQLEYTWTVDHPGQEPSDADVSFVSSNERVVTVSESGLVTAVGPGSAQVSVQVVQPDLPIVEDSIAVSVNIVSTALSIVGGNSFYNDSTLTLSAVLTPSNVSNNDITWSVNPENIVSLSATSGSSVTLTPVNNDVTGEVTVTATNIGGASSELIVTVNERPSLFTAGHHYIVGSALYNSGESVRKDGKSSWNTAKYAYEFSYAVSDPSVYEQFKGTIKFQAGDQFRYLIGADYWVPAWEQQEGWESKGYHIQQDGENNAFVKGQMRFVAENENHEFVVSEAADANIEVVEAGWYDLYAKLYKNADDSLWYSLYIEKVPSLSVEVNEITMGLDESYQIKAHDWIGNVSYTIKSGEDLITLSPTGLVTGKGTAGTAVVTVNDDRNVPVDMTFILQADAHVGKVIYLNANGMFDTDNVVPFVHSWGGEGASAAADTQMNKVEGQTLIYSANIPLDHIKLDFVRCAEGSTSIVWEEIYNQSKDQDIPTDGKDMFTMTGWLEEQDDSHRTYLDGSWTLFDATHVYEIDSGSGEEQQPEDPHGASYIMYGNDPAWEYLPLVENPGNDQELMGSLELQANTEFVIKVGQDDWRHFENNKYASSGKVVIGSAANNEETLHNFKASEDGIYSFYILKDKAAEEGKTVYIGFASTNNVEPNVVKLYFADVFGWANEENKMNAYVWGQEGQKVAWPGEEAEYVGLDNADNKVYSFDVDANLYDHIIFHAGNNKTQDIDISAATDKQGYKPVDPAEMIGEGYKVTSYVYTPKGDTPVTYTVSFDANGGTGSKAAVEGVSGAYSLPDATGLTAPEGKVFAGWALSADGAVITSATINVNADVKLYAIWEEQHVANDVTLYLTANWEGWEKPNAYVFNGANDTSKVNWPGEEMTYVGVNDYNNTIFSYTVDIAFYDRIIFNNGGKQTVDIDISAAANGDAYNLKQYVDNNENNKIEVEKWGTFTNEALTSKQIVYFTNNKGWGDIHFYLFNTGNDNAEAAWPGVNTKNIDKKLYTNEYGQDVYRLLIDTTLYNAFIFNGGGDGSIQTVDILLSSLSDGNNAFYLLDTQDGAGHYEVGQWKYNPLA